MMDELNASGVDIWHVTASDKARAPSRGRRIEKRTALWDDHLAEMPERRIVRACGEIAAAAGVRRLVPFHLSKRYDRRVGDVLNEVRRACPGIEVRSSAGSLFSTRYQF